MTLVRYKAFCASHKGHSLHCHGILFIVTVDFETRAHMHSVASFRFFLALVACNVSYLILLSHNKSRERDAEQQLFLFSHKNGYFINLYVYGALVVFVCPKLHSRNGNVFSCDCFSIFSKLHRTEKTNQFRKRYIPLCMFTLCPFVYNNRTCLVCFINLRDNELHKMPTNFRASAGIMIMNE